jgi:hypothetical protein
MSRLESVPEFRFRRGKPRKNKGISGLLEQILSAGLTEDSMLVETVNEAFVTKIGPHEVEEYAGTKAQVNTARGKVQRAVLSPAFRRMSADRNFNKAIPELSKMEDIVYWIRPADAVGKVGVRVVGLCWDSDGNDSLFFGIIWP